MARLHPLPSYLILVTAILATGGVEQACAAKIKVLPCYASKLASASQTHIQIAHYGLRSKVEIFRRGR